MAKKYICYSVALAILLIMISGCTQLQKSSSILPSAPKKEIQIVGEPLSEQSSIDQEGRPFNPSLSCIGHCNGYAESDDERCFCDNNCEKMRNCCSDFKATCSSQPLYKPQSMIQLLDPEGLSRQYPDFVKCAAISSPELPELTRHIEELRALGHNTVCIGQGVNRFNPLFMDNDAANRSKMETISSIVAFKKAGFAISLDIDTGGPIAEKEYAKLTKEQFLNILEEDALEWAALAEKYNVEYFSPASELPSKLHNLLPESEREQKKIEYANEWYNYMLPKVRERFKGKVFARLGGHAYGLGPKGYDAIAYTSGHSFITDLDKFRQEIRRIYTLSIKQASGAEWWVTTYFAYLETFNPDTPMEYITLRKQLQELQDDYYRIAIEEIDALPPEQRPRGFEGGYMPGSSITNITDEAKEVVKTFFKR